ncbi:MAG TPA: hypothetical protein VM618_05250, partial [Acidimicrobiia bacterium]|nr:hypothetical protein [Acidimicrobiia bacterium]
MRSPAHRGAAALAVLTLVAGPPVALWHLVGNPFPAALPSGVDVVAALTRGDVHPSTVFKVLAAVCWVAWGQLGVALLAEVVATARGRSTPAWPLPTWSRSTAAALVAAALMPPALTTSPAPASALAIAEELVAEDRVTDEGVTGELAPPIEDPPAPANDEPTPPDPSSSPPVGEEHMVVRRDTLWGIAADRLGDPHRWREIFELNVGVPQPDGGALAAPGDALRPGWRLALPATETGATAVGDVVVEAGDTLWAIAGERLGDPHRWPAVFEENEGRAQPDGRS